MTQYLKNATVDFSDLKQKLDTPKQYKLADVQHRIKKVAFDVVRFTSGEDTDQLWRVEESVDGPVIVAMYDIKPEKVSNASLKIWDCVPDASSNVNVFYKGEAIKKIASKDVGPDVHEFCRWLPDSLAHNIEFRTALVRDLPEVSRELLISKYPELIG